MVSVQFPMQACMVVMGIPALFRELVLLARLTKKRRHTDGTTHPDQQKELAHNRSLQRAGS